MGGQVSDGYYQYAPLHDKCGGAYFCFGDLHRAGLGHCLAYYSRILSGNVVGIILCILAPANSLIYCSNSKKLRS